MRRRSMIVALAGALALGACSGTTDATLPEDLTESTLVDTTDMEAIAEFQAEIEDLSAAWGTLNAELAASVASIQEDGAIAREEIESGLDTFEQRLDELDVEENVRTAWEELRSKVEQLMTN
jgi:ABC-type glycerol-3-phosphate transport system substrate-binding protein